LNTQPEIFNFLLAILKSQVDNPSRFTPAPRHFTRDGILDFEKFKNTVKRIRFDDEKFETDADVQRHVGVDAYMLLRFMILSCPLELSHVAMLEWDQFKTTWSEAREQAFEKTNKTPEYLYHGSPLSNWHSIMRNGLRVTSGTSWMTSGAAFGTGIYLSDTLNVSFSYSAGKSDIAIGVYEIYDSASYRKAPGIFVVPDENLLLLRYLIYIPRTNKSPWNLLTIDDKLRKNWDEKSRNKTAAISAKQKKVEARITKEIQTLQNAGWQVERSNATTVVATRDGMRHEVTFPYLFPFSAPVISGQPALDAAWTAASSVADFIS
jgi:hypothetical protein